MPNWRERRDAKKREKKIKKEQDRCVTFNCNKSSSLKSKPGKYKKTKGSKKNITSKNRYTPSINVENKLTPSTDIGKSNINSFSYSDSGGGGGYISNRKTKKILKNNSTGSGDENTSSSMSRKDKKQLANVLGIKNWRKINTKSISSMR